MVRIADLLQRDRAALAKVEVLDTGKTMVEAETDVDDVTAVFRFYAEEARKLDEVRIIKGPEIPETVTSQIVKEAVGVCVLIAPWNCELCCLLTLVILAEHALRFSQTLSFRSAGSWLLPWLPATCASSSHQK